MTDATAGRGGVGIRLYTTGGEVVKRTFDQIGDSGKKMWAGIAAGETRVNPAFRAMSAGVGELKGRIDGLAGSAGPAGNVLSNFGAAGIAAAAGLGGMAIALTETRKAMEFASTLTDTAERIGVGVEALQEYRFVADEAGVSTGALEGTLEKLNSTFGALKSGMGDGEIKPVFEALGITKDQLATVQSADDLLLILADTLGQMKDRALQVKFAKSLGVEESLPILRLGSEAIQLLTEDARRLGLVMGDDVVEALDAADRKMEIAQQRIDGSLRLAVSGLADEFAALVTQVAGAIGWLVRFDTQLRSLDMGTAGDGGERGSARGVFGRVGDAVRGRTAEQGNADRDAALKRLPGWITGRNASGGQTLGLGFGAQRLDEMRARDTRVAALQTGVMDVLNGTGGYATQTNSFASEDEKKGGGRKGGGAGKAEREAEQRQQRFDRVKDQIERLGVDVERAMNGQFRSIEESAGISRIVLAEEAKQRDLLIERGQEEFARTDGLRGISDAEAAILRAKEAELLAAKSDAVLQEERRDLAAYGLRQDEASIDDALALMSIDAEMAATATERYRIEREILIATMEIARRRKKAALDGDPNLDDSQRADILARGDAVNDARIQSFDRLEEDRVRETFKAAGREVVDAIKAGRLGEYIGDRLKEKMLDGALDALFSALKGGGQSGGGGFWGQALSFGMSLFGKGGGKASGGGTKAGFAYGMAEHGPELFMLGGQGQVTSFAETSKMVSEYLGGASGARDGGSGMTVNATYAPNISVTGSGPEIDALRRQLAEERANFRGNVIQTVNDAIERRQVG